MTTATLPQSSAPAVGRPNATQIGTLVWLSSELMFFGALFAMFFTLHSMVPDVFLEGGSHFRHGFALLNTVILVLSSFTCQMGVWAAEGHFPWTGHIAPRKSRTGSIFNIAGWGMVEWYTLTFLMGAVFVAGQATEYTELVHAGVTMSSSPFGSIFYLSTGFHGLHVLGGLIAFLFVLARAFSAQRFTQHEQVAAICISYYWHFVDVVWIVLFFVVYLMDPVFKGAPMNWAIF
ncbi:heme-copper oxidase subunit III [Brachybacterium sp. EF45031]|uniref:aa3-type cytochrome oxidase subunit III n=1 Tax=Brachybacterium sillae TaxID=2810536 RepID=UPI00217E4280|nr:heme-copper oxidase subunit III [Brachybacterium sillae]MCS6710484.1 heme-copper oxidase subunit III [Brachybacterium sillae]